MIIDALPLGPSLGSVDHDVDLVGGVPVDGGDSISERRLPLGGGIGSDDREHGRSPGFECRLERLIRNITEFLSRGLFDQHEEIDAFARITGIRLLESQGGQIDMSEEIELGTIDLVPSDLGLMAAMSSKGGRAVRRPSSSSDALISRDRREVSGPLPEPLDSDLSGFHPDVFEWWLLERSTPPRSNQASDTTRI